MIFASAGLFTLFWILYEKRKMHWRSLYRGFAMGIPNQLSSLFFLMGLKSIPATVAYPFYASGVVLLSILSDIFIWRKVFTVKQRLALGLLICGVILVSLGR
jgi:multidrug transporter EmrE-like cation transporter